MFVFVRACVFDILGRGGERGQIAASLSHIIGQLFFIHRNEGPPPPSTYPARYDACICPLLSSKNTHSTHSVYMCVSAYVAAFNLMNYVSDVCVYVCDIPTKGTLVYSSWKTVKVAQPNGKSG